MTKMCKKCLTEKSLEQFYKNKKIKSGYESKCKDCTLENIRNKSDLISSYNKNYYSLNKENIDKKRFHKRKEYYQVNKEDICEKRKEYYSNNKKSVKERNRKYVIKNKESVNLYKKEWALKNIDRKNERHKYRMKNDNLYKLSYSIRSLIGRIKNESNNIRTLEVLGCEIIYCKEYLESKFEDWMSWENHGLYNGEFKYGWDIDHIIPLSSARDEEELIKLGHYTNLQPLCSKVNRYIKKDKLLYENL